MATKAIPFIGILKLWYCDPLKTAITKMADVTTLISSATAVENVHGDTWNFTQDDPSVTEYVNQLTGEIYYRERTAEGKSTINFTMGEYDYATKAALQGGEVIQETESAVGWKKTAYKGEVFKGIIAQTKTGNYIIFSNAHITAKTDKQDHNLGLGVTAVACESEKADIAPEYWIQVPQG